MQWLEKLAEATGEGLRSKPESTKTCLVRCLCWTLYMQLLPLFLHEAPSTHNSDRAHTNTDLLNDSKDFTLCSLKTLIRNCYSLPKTIDHFMDTEVFPLCHYKGKNGKRPVWFNYIPTHVRNCPQKEHRPF